MAIDSERRKKKCLLSTTNCEYLGNTDLLRLEPLELLFPDIAMSVLIHSSGAAKSILNKAVFHQVKEGN